MHKILVFILLIQAGVMASAPAEAKDKILLEEIEWSDIWVVDANQDGLPRVLMVGDSITQGYFRTVDGILKGKADCARYTTSMFMANPDYFAELKIILKRHQFSVIQVNNGLHGWEYTEQQYGQSLPKLMDFLKKYGRGATIVWATTTPRRNPQNPAQLSADNDRVKERNRIAVEYMTKHGIAVDDLYSLVADHPEYYRDDHTHFNDQGRAVEGKQVSEVILQALKDRKR
jgi:hypothetical protein